MQSRTSPHNAPASCNPLCFRIKTPVESVTWARLIATSPTDVTWDESLLPRLPCSPIANWTFLISLTRNTVLWRLIWVGEKNNNIVLGIFPLPDPSNFRWKLRHWERVLRRKNSTWLLNSSLPLRKQTTFNGQFLNNQSLTPRTSHF